MATRTWKGFISFGLLSIPVGLAVAARDEHISLNMLHSSCKGRIRMPRTCEICKTVVPSEEIVKAYPTGNDAYVVLTEQEIDAIEPQSGKTIEISHCVRAAEVDEVYLGESFFILPEAPGLKAYGLLVRALKDSGRVALAQICKSNREHIVLLRPRGTGLVAHFLFYPSEVHKVAEFDSIVSPDLSKNEIALALKLVESLASDFCPDEFENGYEMRLSQLIASKMDSKVAAPTPVNVPTKVPTIDIASALIASLASPKRKAGTEEAAPKGKAKKGKKAA